jgi:hypothetical protein
VVHEEFVEIRELAHPPEAEETCRRSRSDRCHERCEVGQRERFPSSFREAGPRSGQDQPGAREQVVLAKDQMCGEIPRRPRYEQNRRCGAERAEQVAQQCPLNGVEVRTAHALNRSNPGPGLPGPKAGPRRRRPVGGDGQ